MIIKICLSHQSLFEVEFFLNLEYLISQLKIKLTFLLMVCQFLEAVGASLKPVFPNIIITTASPADMVCIAWLFDSFPNNDRFT